MDIIDGQGSSYSLAGVQSSAVGNIPMMDLERTLPRQLSTGSTRGTQTVGYGTVKIDGSNNRITIGDTTTGTTTLGDLGDTTNAFGLQVTNSAGLTINFGILSDASLGMEIIDPDGFVLFRLNGQTWYWYDKNTDKNVMQIGKLPNSLYGEAVARSGVNVSDAISS